VTGMYSAGKLTTNSSPNYSQYPNLLPSTNMYIAGAKKIKPRKSFRSRRYKYNKSTSRKKIHKMKKIKSNIFQEVIHPLHLDMVWMVPRYPVQSLC